ncbi:MAG: DEAD/DEAH box helicase, partial [Opitutales bacterium]
MRLAKKIVELPFPMTLTPQSITVAEDAPRLCWRLLLPPNLASCAPRDKIPVKLEAQIGSETRPGNQVTQPVSADPPQLIAALLIESWNGGKLPAFLQLTRDQLAQLITPLSGEPSFFFVKAPGTPIAWDGNSLPGVTEHVETGEATPPQASLYHSRSAKPKPRKAEPRGSTRQEPSREAPNAKGLFRERPAEPPALASREDTELSPMEVDGSPQYISIALPSRGSPLYASALELVKENGFSLDARLRRYFLRGHHLTLNFLAAHWTELEETFNARFSANFRQRIGGALRRAEPEVHAQEQRGGGFEVEVALTAPGVDPTEIDRALARGQNYVDTPKGAVLLESGGIQQLHELQRRLGGAPDVPLLARSRRNVSPAELTATEEALVELAPGFQPPESWKRRSGALRERDRLPPPPLGESLAGLLRDYQRLGVAWLWHLHRSGLGGILADEMGLGKTIQALALLTLIAEETNAPALVVCPAALLENWRREAAKFAPELAVTVHHGTGRAASAESLPRHGLVITSYGTLSRDEALFAAHEFATVVADEAQHVKNRRSQAAKALRSVPAATRFVLTGTPLENSPEDLVSLFDFLLPGYLPKPPKGQQSPEERAWRQQYTRDRAAPYLLRRTKATVAKELPEKLERVLYCNLEPKQAALYRELQQAGERELLDLAGGGANEGRQKLAALNQLTKLRQVCAEPRVLREDFEAAQSAKWNVFRELLDESVDDGHRILVFSQFTSVLGWLRRELDAMEIGYEYLDGQTRDRQARVDRFNADAS